jgi:purine-nucleoside phosphorylase
VNCDVLLLGAFHPELAPLAPLLGPSMRSRVGRLEVAAAVVGIGLPVAAAGAALRLVEQPPGRVVFVGTCGAYRGGGLAIGEVAVPARVRLSSPCLVDGLAQLPEPMSSTIEADAGAVVALAGSGGRRCEVVATTLGITVDDAAAARVASVTGAAVEHLEAYAVAAACAARGVPFAAALGVANDVGSAARDQWRTHHRAAAAAAVNVVTSWLTRSSA